MSNKSDIILTGRLIPTNLQDGSYLTNAMKEWVNTSASSSITVDGDKVEIDQKCKVSIENPYQTDCSQGSPNTGGSPTPKTGAALTNNNDDDDNSAGAAVGGAIAALVIICVTIVVIVLIVMLLRRREKRYTQKML